MSKLNDLVADVRRLQAALQDTPLKHLTVFDDVVAALTAAQQPKKKLLGCDYQGKHFGANYEDACCIDGYLWDLDSCDEPGGPLRNGGDDPCPKCNPQPEAEHVRVPEGCEWSPWRTELGSHESSVYETGCGHTFELNAGGLSENGFKFCYSCGKPIAAAKESTNG